jgi:hypothetical protein
MTLRAAVTVDRSGVGTAVIPYTPASSDTFSINDLPGTLRVSNGSGGTINVTPVDGGKTDLGSNAAALSAQAIAASGTRHFVLTPTMADATGVVTVNFSATASVLCEFTRTG